MGEESGAAVLPGESDMDRAVAAAKKAFGPWSATDVSERADLLARISEDRIPVIDRR